LKRRSRTSEPPEPTFFVDRDLAGKRFLAILREASIRVVDHNDHFAPTTTDGEWLSFVGSRGLVAITRDKLGRHSLETRQLMEAEARVPHELRTCAAPSPDRFNIFDWKPQLLENTLKAQRVLRVPLMRLGCLNQVVAQRGNSLVFRRVSDHGFWTINFQAWSAVETFELRVRQRDQHSVGTSARGRHQRSPLANSQREVDHVCTTKVRRFRSSLAKYFSVHEQAVEKNVNLAGSHALTPSANSSAGFYPKSA
jgi:hypothetical protein